MALITVSAGTVSAHTHGTAFDPRRLTMWHLDEWTNVFRFVLHRVVSGTPLHLSHRFRIADMSGHHYLYGQEHVA